MVAVLQREGPHKCRVASVSLVLALCRVMLNLVSPFFFLYSDSKTILMPGFALLEELSLDDNQLSDLTTFASLAGLRR